MKTMKSFLMAALALTFAACSNDDKDILNPAQTAKGEGITITATLASKDAGATTRAVSEGTNEIVASWAENEHIAILYTVGSEKKVADATITSVDGSGTATISFTVDGSTADNTACTLVYPAKLSDGTTTVYKDDFSDVKDYADLLASQDGKLSANLDVRVGAGTIQTTTPSLDVTTQPEAQFAIWKLTLGSAAKNLRVLADNATIAAATLATAGTNFTIAVPAVSSKTVTIVASDESKNCYYYSKASVSLDAGKYYQSTPAMTTIAGAIGGLFSVSASKKAFFSKGNLKYNGSAWSFFDNQYDYLATHDGTNWDKFGWSTSTNYGMSTSTSNDDYSGDFVDWGATMGTGWRTLTSDEWKYLVNTRASGSNVFGTENGRYAPATINTNGTGVKGILLFPDGVTIANTEVTTAGTVNGTSEYATKCTSAQWTALESKGCVFLPAAGYRQGSSVGGAGSTGYYWSGTANDPGYAYRVSFISGNLNPGNNYIDCHDGYSVRLVRPAE